MKKLLLSSVALFGLSTAALAADLPRRQYIAPAPVVAVPVFTWTGFYIGGNAGYGFSNNDNRNGLGRYDITTGNEVAPAGSLGGLAYDGVSNSVVNGQRNRDNSGFIGGGQI